MNAFYKITENWDYRHWFFIGGILQIMLIMIAEGVFQLLPENENKEPKLINLSTELNFIEYQEPTLTPQVQQTKDLSEEIIETKKEKDTVEQINWQNAVDPSLDFSQRYSPRISISISPDDYPERAKKSNLGSVKVSVALYIDANGRIRDILIRKIESTSGNVEFFQNEFMNAVRKIFLEKSKLLNKPYEVNGIPQDFIWYTSVTFILE